ncbi:MAG: DUF5777 family beta-barrel protein [Calditrichia bacterium]
MSSHPRQSRRSIVRWFSAIVLSSAFLVIIFLVSRLQAIPVQGEPETSDLQKQVMDIFSRNCTSAGCHSGTYPQQGMDLTPDMFFETTVNQPSVQKPGLKRVQPGNPDSSYLVMKIMGAEGITGLRMPFGREPLSQKEVSTIVEWIKSLAGSENLPAATAQNPPLLPFAGWKVVNSPTARTLESGRWLFLIGHRFFPRVNDGYNTLYGLDGSAGMFLNLGYAISDNLLVNLGRSNVEDDVELSLRYNLKRQYTEDAIPLAAAVQFTTNWLTQEVEGKDRLRSEAFKYSLQVPVSHQLAPGYSIIVVPGILLNPDSETEGEDPLITTGFGGKAHLYKSVSVIGEWSAILTGYSLTRTLGEYNRFDTWAAGIEIDVGGHAFQIVATNSMGLTTDQYMRGGDLDIRDGDLRLGFNIFRILQF